MSTTSSMTSATNAAEQVTKKSFWMSFLTVLVGLILSIVAMFHPGFQLSTNAQWLLSSALFVASALLAGWMHHVSHSTAQMIIDANSTIKELPSLPVASTTTAKPASSTSTTTKTAKVADTSTTS